MFNHPYPCRKTMWIPDPKSDYRDLSTSGDHLRLWRVVYDMASSRAVRGRDMFASV
ncbi:unnamed protein product [Clavelina lepadiformis]|uniref:Uncharacterized protein n=1 Tax=Clavelina lepadiformis TaxID=159417 RepID=A0ABP0FTU3_CLALP